MDKEHQAKRFWLIELWIENRELFKDFVRHIVSFLLFLTSLEGLHRLLKLSTLSPHELNLLSRLHFYMNLIILLVFAFSFIITVLKSEFGGSKKWQSSRRIDHS